MTHLRLLSKPDISWRIYTSASTSTWYTEYTIVPLLRDMVVPEYNSKQEWYDTALDVQTEMLWSRREMGRNKFRRGGTGVETESSHRMSEPFREKNAYSTNHQQNGHLSHRYTQGCCLPVTNLLLYYNSTVGAVFPQLDEQP